MLKPPFQYVIVHRSCTNHMGVLLSQGIHAATESLRTVPVSPDMHVGVLQAEKSEDLVTLSAKLTEAGIHHVLIREPDPPYSGAATAVGIEPQDRGAVRDFVAHFKALR